MIDKHLLPALPGEEERNDLVNEKPIFIDNCSVSSKLEHADIDTKDNEAVFVDALSEIDNGDIPLLEDVCDTDWESPAIESDHERMEGTPVDSGNPMKSDLVVNKDEISASTPNVDKKCEGCVDMSEMDNGDIPVLEDVCDTDWESPAIESDDERMEGTPIDSGNPMKNDLVNNDEISASTPNANKKSEGCVDMSEMVNGDIPVLEDGCDTDWEIPAIESDDERMEGTPIDSGNPMKNDLVNNNEISASTPNANKKSEGCVNMGETPERNNDVRIAKRSAGTVDRMSLLDLEARYVGKMLAEVAKSMCAQRFGLESEQKAGGKSNELDKVSQYLSSTVPLNFEEALGGVMNDKNKELDEIDDDYIRVDESQIIVSDTSSIETHGNELYSSDLMKSLARTSKDSGIKAWVVLPKVSVPLSSDWKLLSPSQNLNQFGTPTRLRYSAESVKHFANILSRHSPYCCWTVYENFVKKPGSRKEGCVYFRARAKCTLKDCEHNAILTIGSRNSKRMQIHFINDVNHKRGHLAATKICGKARDNLANYFVENNTVPPSKKYRDDLSTLSDTSFLAGNMSGVGTSNGPYQKIASLARQAAKSCETLREKVLSLQETLRQMDEEESIKLKWTFRTEFGYIQKPIVNPDNLQIILMDQIMAMLYHEHVCNDVLYIDATGSVTDQAKWLSKVLYYAAVVRHPYGRTPPLPVAEFITNKHDQFAIEEFLRMLHEKEYRKYKKTTNPRMIMTDFSWAIIQACLKVFCSENLSEYLNRAFRIVSGSANGEDFLKTRLHVCAAHMMKLNKMHATAKHCKDFDTKSQVHFAMRLFGRLINCQSLDDA